MAIARIAADDGDGIAFLVSAGIVYEIIAAACSSPQTTEINASSRAKTLMKWVHIGLIQSALFVGAAAYFDRRHARAYLTGGGAAAVIMYGSYLHAKRAGTSSSAPGTEDTNGPPGQATGLAWDGAMNNPT
jgi:hypothetical protein